MRKFGISPQLESSILEYLNSTKSLEAAKKLSESILKLSDYFINPQSLETPWNASGAIEAYASYFLPLGVARIQSVIHEAQKLGFFEGLNSYVDFGSGPGTTSFALENILKNGTCIESSDSAVALHKKLKAFQAHPLSWYKRIDDYKKIPNQKTVLTMSYSLNELKDIPKWIFDFDAVMILEPSTQKDFVRLSNLRTRLIEKGWSIWAPCTHQARCPLSGGRDWCHDRIEFDPPSWWTEVEAHLPMKNSTITYSYLLARKDKAPNFDPIRKELSSTQSSRLGRLTGDQLVENGKTRQLVCQTEEREFLSWLHKEGPAPNLYRGEYVLVPENTDKRGNELRIKS